MGHYDSCYEDDEQEQREAERIRLRNYMQNRIGNMSLDNLQFLNEIVDNLKEYRTFFYVIDKRRP